MTYGLISPKNATLINVPIQVRNDTIDEIDIEDFEVELLRAEEYPQGIVLPVIDWSASSLEIMKTLRW